MSLLEESREELQQKVAQNRELMTQLTKKNDQFIFDLNKVLEDSDLSEEKKVLAFNDMLTALVEGQKTGVTAKQLYGTPTEAADAIINAPEPLADMTFGKIMLDNFLMMFAFLAVMVGLMSMLSKAGQAPQGILATVIGAMAGAFSFYLIYKFIYSYDQPGADQSKRPGGLKSGLIMALCFVPWIFVYMIASLLPAAINPPVDPILSIALGAMSFAIRHWLKKKYNLRSTFFMGR